MSSTADELSVVAHAVGGAIVSHDAVDGDKSRPLEHCRVALRLPTRNLKHMPIFPCMFVGTFIMRVSLLYFDTSGGKRGMPHMYDIANQIDQRIHSALRHALSQNKALRSRNERDRVVMIKRPPGAGIRTEMDDRGLAVREINWYIVMRLQGDIVTDPLHAYTRTFEQGKRHNEALANLYHAVVGSCVRRMHHHISKLRHTRAMTLVVDGLWPTNKSFAGGAEFADLTTLSGCAYNDPHGREETHVRLNAMVFDKDNHADTTFVVDVQGKASVIRHGDDGYEVDELAESVSLHGNEIT